MTVDPKAFVKGCSLVARAIRLRADAAWDPEDYKLKFASFSSEFPEVESHQFLWACEQWIQAQTIGTFLMFPSWRELMAPLYRCEAGLANRSWGPKADLPGMVRFKQAQLAMLPGVPRSLAGAPDPANAEAYQVVSHGRRHTLPPGLSGKKVDSIITDELWQEHVRRAEEYAANLRAEQSEGSPRKGTDRRAVERKRLQHNRRANPAVD